MRGRCLVACGTIVASLVFGGTSRSEAAMIVHFDTVLGGLDVDLFEDTTPLTVTNFVSYVEAGDYANTIIHRSVPGFIVQGGGFTYGGSLPLDAVPQRPAVLNEPVHSNVRGTIAMAKLGGDPNSATNEWFFNLADNSANLDNQNGGFTAFGQVLGNGMDVLDAIALLPGWNFGSPFNNLPLRDFANDGTNPDGDNFVIIRSIQIVLPEPGTLGILTFGSLTLLYIRNRRVGCAHR